MFHGIGMDANAIDALIAGCPIFSQLNSTERQALAASSALVTYQPDETIFTNGDAATQFFVITDGDVLIRRREDETRTRAIAQFISGESFGEMDVLRSTTRAVEAIANTQSTLLVIPGTPRTFSSLVTEQPIVFAGVLRKLIAYVAGRIRANNDILGKNNAWIEEIRRQVYTDKLTGLFNATYLKDALLDFPPAHGTAALASGNTPATESAAAPEGADTPVTAGPTTAVPATGRAAAAQSGETSVGTPVSTAASVLAFKPDRFKEINDTFGHEVGDRAIQLLSRLFRETITPIGSPIRYRGNEFLALLPGRSAAQADVVAKQLLEGVSHIDLTDVTNGTPVQLTVSIGIADTNAPSSTKPPSGTDAPSSTNAPTGTDADRPTGDALVQRAYETMMNARNDGGARVYHDRHNRDRIAHDGAGGDRREAAQ